MELRPSINCKHCVNTYSNIFLKRITILRAYADKVQWRDMTLDVLRLLQSHFHMILFLTNILFKIKEIFTVSTAVQKSSPTLGEEYGRLDNAKL